jgi:small-conductance mechanosensitive channel
VIAALLLVLETLVCTTLWGPLPAGWRWVGAHIYHSTGNGGVGIAAAFAGMIVTMMATLAIAMRLDHAWKIVRRASGHHQERGALERIFVISMAVAGLGFVIWFIVIQGPGPELAPSGVAGWRY